MGLKRRKTQIISIIVIFLMLFIIMSCDEEDCWVCFNGKCYKCNGKGYDKIDNEACDVCKGSGVCFNCNGTGKNNK